MNTKKRVLENDRDPCDHFLKILSPRRAIGLHPDIAAIDRRQRRGRGQRGRAAEQRRAGRRQAGGRSGRENN